MGELEFEDYLVLGDDVVIANREVAIEYMSIMNSLGVEISTSKRIFPVKGFSGVEFASQYICNDVNLSPLPIGNLFENSIERLFSLWTAILERGVAANYCNEGHLHGPDFRDSFPLAKGAKGHEELSSL